MLGKINPEPVDKLKEKTMKKARKEVIQSINRASNDGMFQVTITPGRLSKSLKDELESLGYTIVYNETFGFYVIRW